MDCIRNHAMTLLKMLLLLIPASSLTGCLTVVVDHVDQIHEKMTTQSVFRSKDGDFVLKVRSSYYRLGAFDEKKEVPLDQYEPRERYVIFSATGIKSIAEGTTHTAGSTILIKEIPFPSTCTKIVPDGFLDPGADKAPLPEWLDLTDARQYQPDEPIPLLSKTRIRKRSDFEK